ncbi:MAG: archease [Elusimicrobia bacterium]|nr:archease [Elusimicrobiota bacterium]
MKPGFRILPHTSEMGLELKAPDWASFYRCAAEGLLAVYGARLEGRGRARLSWSFRGGSPEDVLVAWLNELVFLVGTKRFRLSGLEVLQAAPDGLRVRILGERRRRLPLEREIKAATYHGLKVRALRSGLTARLILDV